MYANKNILIVVYCLLLGQVEVRVNIDGNANQFFLYDKLILFFFIYFIETVSRKSLQLGVNNVFNENESKMFCKCENLQ